MAENPLLGGAPPPAPPEPVDAAIIGVPAGFSPPFDTLPPLEGAVAAAQYISGRYFSGAEFEPAAWSPEVVADLQELLAAAGLLTGKIRIGVWDEASADAYRDALAYANRSGLVDPAGGPPVDAIRRLASAQVVDTEQRQAQLPMRPADPDDLADQAEAMFRETLGRAPNADELQQVAMRWNRYQREAFEAEQAIAADDAAVAQGATPDETLTTVDPESRMRRFFEDRYGGAIDRAQRRDERAQRQPALDASLSNIPVTGQF